MYYRINKDLSEAVIGTNAMEHTNGAIYPINIWDPLFIMQWNFKKLPDDIVTPIPKLRAKAKLTYLIAANNLATSSRLTISNKLKCIFEKYANDNIVYVLIKMLRSSKEISGYWMTNIFEFTSAEVINYSKCQIKYWMCNNDAEVSINNHEEFLNVKKVRIMNQFIS